MSNYLVHSAKGSTWKNHKYVKIVNGKYYYSNDLNGTASSGDTATTQANVKTYLDSLKVKKLGIKAKSSSSKSNSSSSKKESSEKSSSSKSSSEKSTKTSSTKTSTKDTKPNSYYGVKNAISKKISLGEKDSVYSSANEDGSWNADVVFEDGSTQTFVLDKDYNIVSYTEKQVKHSNRLGGMYYGVITY